MNWSCFFFHYSVECMTEKNRENYIKIVDETVLTSIEELFPIMADYILFPNNSNPT